MEAAAWIGQEEKQPEWESLRPPGMSSVSHCPPSGQTGQTVKTPQINIAHRQEDAKDLGRDITKAVSRILSTNDTLEQDKMEGVEDKDWESED